MAQQAFTFRECRASFWRQNYLENGMEAAAPNAADGSGAPEKPKE